MPKIQNVGVGGFIRGLKGMKGVDSRGTNMEAWKVMTNEGNAFKCCPVLDGAANPVKVDETRHYMVPIDTRVDQVTIGVS